MLKRGSFAELLGVGMRRFRMKQIYAGGGGGVERESGFLVVERLVRTWHTAENETSECHIIAIYNRRPSHRRAASEDPLERTSAVLSDLYNNAVKNPNPRPLGCYPDISQGSSVAAIVAVGPPHPRPTHAARAEPSSVQQACMMGNEWTAAPSHRDYSTLGIDGFLCHPDPQGEDLEVTGDVKTDPDDFRVREIGFVPPSSPVVETAERSNAGRSNKYHQMETIGWIRAVAGLQNEGRADEVRASPSKKTRTKVDVEDEASLRCDTETDLGPAQTTTDEVKAKNVAEFLFRHGIDGVEATIEGLRGLNDSALESIASSCEKSGQTEDDKEVWIDTTRMVRDRDSSHWRDLHRLVRQENPFVQTETSNVGPDGSSSGERRWIRASIDTTFLPLVPFLAKPCEDLLLMYKFRNDGPIVSTVACRNSFGRRRSHGKSEKKCAAAVSKEDSSQGTIRLRLRMDLSRDQRRDVHQIISKHRGLETTTQNGVHIDPTDSNSPLTSAIVVSWSRNVLSKKRKRQALHAAVEDRLFCVLRKANMEHQVAMKRITRALKCRNSDVGVAGKINMAKSDSICSVR